MSPVELFNHQYEQALAVKHAEEQQRKEELRQQAKKELEYWYKERQQQMQYKRQTMKSDEDILRMKSLETSSKELCNWTKVVQLLEFSSGTQLSKSKRDITRMKSCIINARGANDATKVANGVKNAT
jgi:Zn-dependent metalloprotease